MMDGEWYEWALCIIIGIIVGYYWTEFIKCRGCGSIPPGGHRRDCPTLKQ